MGTDNFNQEEKPVDQPEAPRKSIYVGPISRLRPFRLPLPGPAILKVARPPPTTAPFSSQNAVVPPNVHVPPPTPFRYPALLLPLHYYQNNPPPPIQAPVRPEFNPSMICPPYFNGQPPYYNYNGGYPNGPPDWVDNRFRRLVLPLITVTPPTPLLPTPPSTPPHSQMPSPLPLPMPPLTHFVYSRTLDTIWTPTPAELAYFESLKNRPPPSLSYAQLAYFESLKNRPRPPLSYAQVAGKRVNKSSGAQ